jgi:hypothetical protein
MPNNRGQNRLVPQNRLLVCLSSRFANSPFATWHRPAPTDVVDAEAFRSGLSFELDKIEPMLASLQVRRDAIIREIGAYRDSLARQVKKAIDDVIEVPAKDVEITPRLASPAPKKSTTQ